MTLLEKIEAWVIPNTSRLISAMKLREILIDVANAISPESQYKSEKQEYVFPSAVSETEHVFEHTLDSMYIDVRIYIGGLLLDSSLYQLVAITANEILIIKPTGEEWDTEIIISKIH